MLLLAVSVSILIMGTCYSKNDKVKRNKDHNRQKMFRFGLSFGRNDLNLEGHFQMGYNSKTIKNYGPIEKRLVLPENLPSTITESANEQTVLTSRSDTEVTEA
jgi:hypothetical protein